MRKIIPMAAMTLLAGALNSRAEVTAQGWYHFGEVQDYYGDSSGNGRRFQSAFSTGANGTGNANAIVTATGVGGPLDGTAWHSTKSLRFGDFGARQAGMWSPGIGGVGYNPPATNYGLELWCLPTDKGYVNGDGSWLINAGRSTGSAVLRIQDSGNGDGTSVFIGTVNGLGDVGTPAPADTTKWTHLAIVNADGVVTFYVNGVASGPSYPTKVTGAITGDIFVGHPDISRGPNGLIDEVRIFTFAPGKFSPGDLLIPPPGPNIVTQPQSATVWTGGAAPFAIETVIDSTVTYQWLRDGNPIQGATAASYMLPIVTVADNGSTFSCKATNPVGSVTSAAATLTVVPAQTADVAAYRNAVKKESSLVSLFPADDNTGTTLTNTVNNALNGVLELNAAYDGRTNVAFGQRALAINEDGDVSLPANDAFDFTDGDGSVEALVYLSRVTLNNAAIFSVAGDGGIPVRCALLASKDGASLIYTNDQAFLTWAAPVNLVGRLAHVVFVFDHQTNVTAYLDGQSLGTKQQPGFGADPGQPAWIGSFGPNGTGKWAGTIDELAVYSGALSLDAVQAHYSSFAYGANVVAPSITQQSSSKTWYAGGSPTLSVTVSGSLPFNYQWTSNGVAIAGANRAALTLPQTTTNFSATYAVTVRNSAGQANSQPIALTFLQPPDNYAAVVMNDNPVSYWRFDETSGPTAADVAGANDGTYKGAMTFGTSSILSQLTDSAVNFAGGYVEVPYSPSLNPNGPFTLEYWAKTGPKFDPNNDTLVAASSQGRLGSARYGWAVYLNNDGPGGFEMHMGDASGVAEATRVGGATPPVANKLYYCVFVYDGTNLQVHVNGKLDFQTPAGFPYTANYTAPLKIGVRTDDNFPFIGVMDEAALYGYALTTNQIQKHYNYSFVSSQVTLQPTNVTDAVETGTVTLTATAAGYPNTYQWVKDGAPLDATDKLNLDGTSHYPEGVTGNTLVIAQATPSDSGRYHLLVRNPLGNTTTIDVTVAVAADTTPPTVAWVGAESNTNRVRVVFSRWITPETAGLAANYQLSGGVTALSVSLTADPSIVDIVTSGLKPGTQYTLSVSGVRDERSSHNLIGANSTAFTSYVLTTGGVAWDFYAKINGTGVDALVTDAQYPDAVYTNTVLGSFSTAALTTGDDLRNNPAFGALGDFYGTHLYGWLKPAATADYTFFIRSDDASSLYLSTDENPENAAIIAYEGGCCNPFKEPAADVTQTSEPQHLIAGKSYYIEAFQKEGGGGDYVHVAWRQAGDNIAAAGLAPIAGEFLSAYAPMAAPKFAAPALVGGQLTLTWTGSGKLQESGNLKDWADVAGSPASGYKVTPISSSQRFYRLAQ